MNKNRLSSFTIPDAPCMDYIFTYMNGEKLPHSRGNVGKYSLYGASGNVDTSLIEPEIFVLKPRISNLTGICLA